MSDSFRFELKESPKGIVEINLFGAIDEQAQLPRDFDFSNFQKIHINFAEVNFINSGGTKAWINFSDAFNKIPELRVVLQNCPSLVVNQINTVSGFLPSNGEVESVLVPVVCKKCDRSFNAPLDLAMVNTEFDELIDKIKPEDCSDSPSCRHSLEVDVLKEYYLRFTNR